MTDGDVQAERACAAPIRLGGARLCRADRLAVFSKLKMRDAKSTSPDANLAKNPPG